MVLKASQGAWFKEEQGSLRETAAEFCHYFFLASGMSPSEILTN